MGTARIAGVLLGLLLGLGGTAADQAQQRATVTTKKGETVEGLFRGATATELVFEVAGKELRIPVDGIKLIAFGGTADEPKSLSQGPLSDAFSALTDLKTAIDIGILDEEHYVEKLQQTLPRVYTFVNLPGNSWGDVRLLLQRAIDEYKAASADWEEASACWGQAASSVEYARALAARPGEDSHCEERTEREATVGSSAAGRLGTGDQSLSREHARVTGGAFNDVYVVTVAKPRARLHVIVSLSSSCGAHLFLQDDQGRQRAHNENPSGQASFLATLEPGVYHLWIGTITPQCPTQYTSLVREIDAAVNPR